MQAEGRMFYYVVGQWNKIDVLCLRLEENIRYYKIIIFLIFFPSLCLEEINDSAVSTACDLKVEIRLKSVLGILKMFSQRSTG